MNSVDIDNAPIGETLSQRDIVLPNTFNLRDLGGYAAAHGRTVRWRRLFRGAGLHRLSGADAEAVRDLGIRVALDLRTRMEIHDRGAFPTDAVPARCLHLSMIPRAWDRSTLRPEAPPEVYLVPRYLEMLETGGPAIAQTINILADLESYPAVFFCSAGKDRTGVLSAIVLSLLGVSDLDIAADYHLSKDRVAQLIEWMHANMAEGPDLMVGQPPTLLSAPAVAMQLFLEALRERHESVADYVTGLGVEPRAIERLRANLLVGA